MIIRHADGRVTRAILVSRTGNTMRVAVEGADDIAEFRNINETWVSEECDVVAIEFAYAPTDGPPPTTLEDCICPQKLAARLIEMLLGDKNPSEAEPRPAATSRMAMSAGRGRAELC